MSKIIPNEETWVGFATAVLNIHAPKVSEVNGAVDLTGFLVSITANATGNTVPTPTLKSLFETTIPGTTTATFSADFYRDDDVDLAWTTLPRGTEGFIIISRFGGGGTAHKPILADLVEVWPVHVTSAANSALASNTAQTFTVTASVPVEPDEHAVVAA